MPIRVILVTPERILCEQTASYVQLPAHDGYMGFLPGHAPLISLAGDGVLTCRTENNSDTLFSVMGGYFEIHQNVLTILADRSERADEINIDRAIKARDRALNRLNEDTPGKWDLDRAKASLLRALSRIQTVNRYRSSGS
ncbi:ATP synthase F1 subunit epsilon [bacterium]|nr:ATP synthase F1 subunit epsilon [candidate division CSSED10-310 bacterium]